MTRLPLVSVWTTAALLGAGAPAAEERPPVLTPTPSAAAAATPNPATPARPRAVSPTAAAQLTAAAPKYQPAPAKPAEPPPDLREIDRPRNTIIRLPSYLVEEDKVPVLKEREVLTPAGRLDLALKRHPGLRLGSFWLFRNDGIALAMLAEEERLERMREMNDLVSLLPASDQKRVKPIVEQTFMRQPDLR